MRNNKLILISSAVVYKNPEKGKKSKAKPLWFVVRTVDESGWEIPKTAVRRGESSVRAVIRLMGEQGGMRAKVLEEAGRSGGSANINGKIVSQRYLFYLMVCKGDSEVLGFPGAEWLEYEKAVRRLSSKKEQNMLKRAREIAKEIQKTNKTRDEFEEEELPIDPEAEVS